jgi:hypothetical protein
VVSSEIPASCILLTSVRRGRRIARRRCRGIDPTADSADALCPSITLNFCVRPRMKDEGSAAVEITSIMKRNSCGNAPTTP